MSVQPIHAYIHPLEAEMEAGTEEWIATLILIKDGYDYIIAKEEESKQMSLMSRWLL